jgi:hypothetical protein
MLATGWQPHSVRGAISGLLRMRLGLHVVLTRNAACERVYRASADAARVQTQTLQTSVCSLTLEG